MLETKQLRMWDIVTAAIFILVGAGAIYRILTHFPLKDKYGGVDAVWYVSPGLVPLIISGLMIVLGTILMVHAVKAGGWQTLVEQIGQVKLTMSENTLRFWAVVVPIVTYVYLLITRVDFFIASLIFLLVLMFLFYLEYPGLLKKLLLFYVIGVGVYFVLILLKADLAMNTAYPYAIDLLALLFLIAYSAYCWTQIRGNAELRQKFWTAVQVAIMSILIIAPIFKYVLIVPLPKEGIVVSLTDAFWYSPSIKAFRKGYPLGKYAIMIGFYLLIVAILLGVKKLASSLKQSHQA